MPIIKKSKQPPVEISVVVPIWNDEESIAPFIASLFASIKQEVSNFEVIFCADPSKDNTHQIIRELSLKDSRIKALFFATRVGQPASTIAGLAHCSGQAAIVIDVDLQDPIELLPTMIDLWRSGKKLIIPRRVSRSGEPLTKKLTAAIGYSFLSRFGNAPIPKNTGDFRLMDRSVIERVLSLRESHVFLRGLVAIVDQDPILIDFVRPPRPIGKTKYNKWFGGIRSGLNGIISYSTALLDFIIIIGLALAALSLIIGSKYLVYKVTGHYIPPGNTQLFVMVTFIGSMQLIAIGVMGLYVGRIFEEVKVRPRWFVGEGIGFKDIDFTDSLRTQRTFSGD